MQNLHKLWLVTTSELKNQFSMTSLSRHGLKRQVIATKGGTLTLDNGQQWNVAKCFLCPRPENDTFYAEYKEYEQEPVVAADFQFDNDVEANLAPVLHRRNIRVTRPPDRYSPYKN